MNLNMTIEECSYLMCKSTLYVRNAIEHKYIPGSFNKNGKYRTFHIPRFALYNYMGMNENQITEHEKEYQEYKEKKDAHTDES